MAKQKIIYGFHAVASRLRRHPATVHELYVDETRQDSRMRDFLTLAQAAGARPRLVAGQRLNGLAGTSRHQGVVAQVDEVDLRVDLDELVVEAGADLLLLVLDGVQDPHNLGACLRVADAMGAHAVLAPRDRAVPLSPTVAKVASGAAETVPYVMVTNLARTLRDLKDHAVWVVGADDQAADDLFTASFQRPMAWVLGAEGSGLRRLTRETCDQLVRIPMFGSVESLNVSVAAGICLYESRRRSEPRAGSAAP
ncbi:MAG: 23S rRNA (guanosine(2251)-2'-O)-methyltransferase RlmB [Betaproteobacteria bacterium]|nr:23S rRNA (guanosine(2251)-2'-O)-methyltransferase RlmB [Betaproteobacteria bacterium]